MYPTALLIQIHASLMNVVLTDFLTLSIQLYMDSIIIIFDVVVVVVVFGCFS